MPEQVILKGIMAEKKYLQRDVANWLDVSEKTISDKINGKIDFKLGEAQIIAKKLNKKVDEIFLGTKLI